MKKLSWVVTCVLIALLCIAPLLFPGAGVVKAGIYNSSSDVTYKEYWIPHSQFTARCQDVGSNFFYLEPGPCEKTMTFNIPDDFSQALKVEIYIDYWRNHNEHGSRFKLNNGPLHTPNVGEDWSRTPYMAEIPKSELQQGSNTITFSVVDGRRGHIHDVAFRIYHDAGHPLVAGPGSDVTPPTGNLTSIVASNGTFAPGAGGTLNVDNDQLTFNATASGAKFVEFHAFYDGYDEDNDGAFIDWHNRGRNNWHPGGTEGGTNGKPLGGTIDHVGTVTSTTSSYTLNWYLPHIKNQSGVRFKVRLVDSAGNVRETAGGESAAFTLGRSYNVETYLISNFQDGVLGQNGAGPFVITRTITLPASLSGYNQAYMIGAYWQNPRISLNGNTKFSAFNSGQDVWQLSIRSLNMNHLQGASNQIEYFYSSGWGQFVEKPGPMIVLREVASTPPTPTPTPSGPTSTPTSTATATSTPTPTATATAIAPAGGIKLYLPIVMR